jgi:fructoselysine-6-P-deglycase FrlB-like protein
MSLPIENLVTALTATAHLPLCATGSGGSLTAAHLASELHQRLTGMLSKAATPLEVISSPPIRKEQCLLILSAGGRNSDIIAAFKATVGLELSRLIVICSRTQSPLSELAAQYRYVDFLGFDLPSGKDGFLATNSLLAFAVILIRASAAAAGFENPLPADLKKLLCPKTALQGFLSELKEDCAALWSRETLSVLYGPSTRVAAVDLESKFTEAALGSVQIADYRNFAHGRHHWFAKRSESTGVLAFITDDDRETATRTLRLIPPHIPVVSLEIPSGGERAAIASLVTVLHIVGFAGVARSIDPGRPGVPAFGSKIYHLPAFKPARRTLRGFSSTELMAIERKAGRIIETNGKADEPEFWKRAYGNFVARLRKSSFGGIVLDYDGTLCDGRDRFTGIGADIASELTRLLRARIVVGIATGRGRSVRDDFRRCIPKELWNRFFIGYYNGAETGPLTERNCPDGSHTTDQELTAVAEAIRIHHRLQRLANCEYRRKQITIVPNPRTSFPQLLKLVEQIVQEAGVSGVTAVCSSHSLDVLAPGVSKQKLVQDIRNRTLSGKGLQVLCIGDRGQWPGNDFALLAEPLSLSVDEVSANTDRCWNLTPAGYRGVQGTLYYLNSIQCHNGFFSLNL